MVQKRIPDPVSSPPNDATYTYSSAQDSVGTNTTTLVSWDSIIVEQIVDFGVPDTNFTLPEGGTYYIQGETSISENGNDPSYQTELRLNGAPIDGGTSFSQIRQIGQGDELEYAVINNDDNVTLDINAGEGATYLIVIRLSEADSPNQT